MQNKDHVIEEPRSKLQVMFCLTAALRSDRKERCHVMIRSLTPQQATGNALAIAVQHQTTELYKKRGGITGRKLIREGPPG
jgi:hypothetical protein